MNNKASKSRDKTPINQGRSRSFLEQDQHKKIHLQQLTAKAQPLQIFEFPQIQTLRQNFKKEIENPIHAQITMHFAKTAQRCLAHNNVITLYCLNERKPMCVICMYQNNQHKKHKVVPLNRANHELQDQISSYINVVSKDLDKNSKLLNQSHTYLKRVQRDFPQLISRVQNFYMSLHQMLQQKKHEQMQHIQQTWARLRFQYASVSKELENINLYFVQRLGQIKTRGGQQNLLLNRNIASHLIHLSNIIPENLCQYHQNSYESELKKFEEVRSILNNKLVFTSPYKQKIQRTQSRKESSARNTLNTLSPSPKPRSNSKSNSNLKTNSKLQIDRRDIRKDVQKSPTFGKSATKTSPFKRTGSSFQRS